MSAGWRVRGDVVHVDRGARSHVIGSGSYATGDPAARGGRAARAALARDGGPHRARRAAAWRRHRSRARRRHAERPARRRLAAIDVGGRDDRRPWHGRAARRTDALRRRRRHRPRSTPVRSRRARRAAVSPARSRRVASVSRRRPRTSSRAIDLTNSRWDTLRVDRLRTRLAVADGLARLDTLSLLARGANVQAAGTFGLDARHYGTLRFAASVDSLGVLRPWIGTSDTSVVSAPVAEQRARLRGGAPGFGATRRCGAHRAAGARASGRGDARARYRGRRCGAIRSPARCGRRGR